MTSTAMAAARLLREYAEELKRSHTIFSSGAWPEGESEAKAAYEQHIAIASALEAMPAKCLHQIQEPTPVTATDALREAEAALEVAMARILKADPSHSICVTSEAKALVAVRAALAAPAPVLVAQPQLHAALFAARGALQHMKEGGKPTQSLLNEAIAAIDSVAVTEAAPAAVAEHGSREERMVVLQRGKDDIPTVWCDPEIADIVGALNSGGIKTVASCSGHGEKPGGIALADGRQLLLLDSLDAFNSAISTLCPSASAPAAVAVPENVREGAPYDNPAFEKLARELGVWGTAQSAVCAQFWLAATPAAVDVVRYPTEADPATETLLVLNNSDKLIETPPAAQVVLPEPVREALEEAESVLNSINKGRSFAVTVGDEVCYWQRQEWIDWAEKEVLPKVRAAQALLATGGQAHAVEQEPFGYFKAEPFGWTDCGPDDEGAVALYERPQAQADARDAEIQQAVLAERERICAAIKAEDDHCVTEGEYMLDSDDCIKVARGEWVRPVYDAAIATAKGK